jgi:excisionase family DNA binding protein
MATNEPLVQPDPAPAGYMTVREVGARLRLGRTATYRLVHSGRFTLVRIGKDLRLPTHELWDYECEAAGLCPPVAVARERTTGSPSTKTTLPPARRHEGVKR